MQVTKAETERKSFTNVLRGSKFILQALVIDCSLAIECLSESHVSRPLAFRSTSASNGVSQHQTMKRQRKPKPKSPLWRRRIQYEQA